MLARRIRNIVTLTLLCTQSLFAQSLFAQSQPIAYRMTGQISESSSLVPLDFELPEEVNAEVERGLAIKIFEAPAEFYLKINSDKDWSFSLSLLADGDVLATHSLVSQSVSGIVKREFHFDPETLQIDFRSNGGAHLQSLDLDLDLTTGAGAWDWLTDICLVCDALPSPWARGTIDAIETAPIFANDCNFDGRVAYNDLQCANEGDFTMSLLEELGLTAGDLDGDGVVGFADFLRLSENFGGEFGTLDGGRVPQSYLTGDIDGDGQVGFRDFLILSVNFNQVSESHVVPEPAQYDVCLLIALLCLRSRRRSR